MIKIVTISGKRKKSKGAKIWRAHKKKLQLFWKRKKKQKRLKKNSKVTCAVVKVKSKKTKKN